MYQDLGVVRLDDFTPSPAGLSVDISPVAGLHQPGDLLLIPDKSDELQISEFELATLGSAELDDGIDQPSSTPVEGIVIIGRREDSEPLDYFYWWSNQPTSTEPTYPDGGGSINDRATPTAHWGDAPEVEADVVDSARKDDVYAAAEKLQREIAELTSYIDALPDTALVQLPDGTTMRGLQLKSLWATLDFRVTDATFGPGRSGGYDEVTRTATITYTAVNGWDNSDPNGLNFIMLHELVHSSPQGQQVDQDQWLSYVERTGDREGDFYTTSIEFEENEEFANVGALRLATVLRIAPALGYDPSNGYEYGEPDNDVVLEP